LKDINVAVDGPAGAGKSTAAREVASRLNLKYLDTGAMYRALTWKAIIENIDFQNPEEIINLAAVINIDIKNGSDGSNLVYIDGIDVTQEIRTPAVNGKVSIVSKIPEARGKLVARQQKIAEDGGFIMDGRDIGTNVLPGADFKFFLTASLEVRAQRRYMELKEKGCNITLEDVKKEISMRDKIDKGREVAPLIAAKDADLIDTTHMNIEDVIQEIVRKVNKLKAGRT